MGFVLGLVVTVDGRAVRGMYALSQNFVQSCCFNKLNMVLQLVHTLLIADRVLGIIRYGHILMQHSGVQSEA